MADLDAVAEQIGILKGMTNQQLALTVVLVMSALVSGYFVHQKYVDFENNLEQRYAKIDDLDKNVKDIQMTQVKLSAAIVEISSLNATLIGAGDEKTKQKYNEVRNQYMMLLETMDSKHLDKSKEIK